MFSDIKKQASKNIFSPKGVKSKKANTHIFSISQNNNNNNKKTQKKLKSKKGFVCLFAQKEKK